MARSLGAASKSDRDLFHGSPLQGHTSSTLIHTAAAFSPVTSGGETSVSAELPRPKSWICSPLPARSPSSAAVSESSLASPTLRLERSKKKPSPSGGLMGKSHSKQLEP